jgi:hypothetical protein
VRLRVYQTMACWVQTPRTLSSLSTSAGRHLHPRRYVRPLDRAHQLTACQPVESLPDGQVELHADQHE